jgi:hypothetical protein
MTEAAGRRLFLSMVLACVVAITPASSGTISLRWSPVSHSNLAGYRVYYDTVPDAFTQSIDVDLVPETTLSGLADCTDYYVAVKAFDTDGDESPEFSNVVSGWPRPVLTAVSPPQVERNSQVDLVLDGTNFQPGASAVFADPAITVGGVVVNGCQQLVMNITVGANATLGAGDLTVINPDQVFGEGVGLFSVVADATPPVIADLQSEDVGATSVTISWTTTEPADSQVFFRQQGESTYQQTSLDPQLVVDHAVTLQGLSPETTYEFYARSADASGQAATSDVDTVTTLSSSFTYLRFEAEAGVLTQPINDDTGAGAFREGWIHVLDGTPTGTPSAPAGDVSYGFYVPHSADWTVWVRMYGADSNSDSWFERVDGVGFQMIEPSGTGVWEWVAGRSYFLDEGLHTFALGGREDGSQADRILITDDPDFVPTEQPGDDATPPDGVADFAVVAGDGQNSLSWTNPVDAGSLTVVVRYRMDGSYPVSPVDGFPLVDGPAAAGSPDGHDHGNLTNGLTYSYSVFVVDESGNASDPASLAATPTVDAPGVVENLLRSDAL